MHANPTRRRSARPPSPKTGRIRCHIHRLSALAVFCDFFTGSCGHKSMRNTKGSKYPWRRRARQKWPFAPIRDCRTIMPQTAMPKEIR